MRCFFWRRRPPWEALLLPEPLPSPRLSLICRLQFRKATYQLAKSQVDYALGSTGRSFVVGFGASPPLRVHHRGASCPARPAPCSWSAFSSPGPNPQVRRCLADG